MNYYISFLMNNPNEIIFENNINTYFFYLKFKNENKIILNVNEKDFSQFMNVFNIQENNIFGSCDKLYDDINLADYNNNIDYNDIIHIYVIIFKIFHSKNKIINESLYKLKYSEIYNLDSIVNNEPLLLLRAGNVEINAVNSFFYNDKETIKKAIEIIINSNNNDMYIDNKKCWMVTHKNIESTVSYIKQLMTNAGFYINNDIERSYTCLEYFCNEYKNAILKCDYFLNWPFVNCISSDILKEKRRIKKIKYFQHDDDNMYKLLNNKNILFLTPFKNQIDTIYQSGKIYKLRKSNNLENINLYTIEAFLTTYPNKKHKDFMDTINYYFKNIDEIINNNKIDLFTCSAGSYGLILCNYVYTKYNITCLYIGHYINHFFGISSNRTINRDKSNNDYNFENFECSNLNLKYHNIDKIEDNCYGT